ncbi:hypothetical protein Hbl1158_15150 (plasmid) [Halobaculum sp. CBA1158]|uniref:rod-determining factor RdfA n=1 Tax=Halobaculum sp. CBA1158 TaxID=2904243 RepID=UPI001F32AFF6|nr:rod-determining factor RdfA [Halobaculum sp. CBA1158]UIP01472.1 hypothetical protein Hbl1158_15150 [Halobaculum sp. CBA1158]
MSDGGESMTPDPTRSKVGRLIDEYEMTGAGAELEDRWLGRGRESQSLRTLAEWFNERLLSARLDRAGDPPLEGEAANLYRLLTDENVGAGARVDAESTLERAGIDPEGLRSEFVSHQAIHTYLREYRGASKERTPGDRREQVRTTVQRLRGRLVAVAENGLESLAEAGAIALGEFDVIVEVRVFCEDCGTATPVTELLSDGGCECGLDGE